MGNTEAQNNIPILLLQTDVAASTRLQEPRKHNTIPHLLDQASLSKNWFEANNFRVAQAGKRPWNWRL
jgi:hypothetical protein